MSDRAFQDDPTAGPRGAYGLTIAGLPGASELLVPAHASWPLASVRQEIGTPGLTDAVLEDAHATYAFQGVVGDVAVRRDPLTITFTMESRQTDEALLHPFLAGAAAIASRWLDRDAFHAGAFVGRDGVWGILGAKEAGKSSLLAALAAAGMPVVTDDVLVVEDGCAMPGPRCIDLRSGAAEFLGEGRALGRVGARDRWRMNVGPLNGDLPLRGWIEPTWGKELGMRSVSVVDRLDILHANLALNTTPTVPLRFLDYVALPFWRLERPRSWATMAETVDTLIKL